VQQSWCELRSHAEVRRARETSEWEDSKKRAGGFRASRARTTRRVEEESSSRGSTLLLYEVRVTLTKVIPCALPAARRVDLASIVRSNSSPPFPHSKLQSAALQTQRTHDAVANSDDDNDSDDTGGNAILEEVARLEVALAHVIFHVDAVGEGDKISSWAIVSKRSRKRMTNAWRLGLPRGSKSAPRSTTEAGESNLQSTDGQSHTSTADERGSEDEQARVRDLHGCSNLSGDGHDEHRGDPAGRHRAQRVPRRAAAAETYVWEIRVAITRTTTEKMARMGQMSRPRTRSWMTESLSAEREVSQRGGAGR
jgi:hypothetical protein